jgi:hypothetical protein
MLNYKWCWKGRRDGQRQGLTRSAAAWESSSNYVTSFFYELRKLRVWTSMSFAHIFD